MSSESIKEHAQGKKMRFMISCKSWWREADHDDDGRKQETQAAENNSSTGGNGALTTPMPDGDDGAMGASG